MTAYASVLGRRMANCPPAVQALHAAHGTHHGRITVERSAGQLLHWLGSIAGFPPSGDWPLTLTRTKTKSGDLWTRRIGDTEMRSHQWVEGTRLAERVGPVTAVVDLLVQSDALSMQLHRARALGVPMPGALAPKVKTRETGTDMRYHFDVTVALPLTGALLVRYVGYLDIGPDASGPAPDDNLD